MKRLLPGIFTIEGLRLGRVYAIEAPDGLTLVAGSLPRNDADRADHAYVLQDPLPPDD